MPAYKFLDDSTLRPWLFDITISSLHCEEERISLDLPMCYLKHQPPQQRIERNFLNVIKGIYKKLTAGIIFNGKKLNALPLRS